MRIATFYGAILFLPLAAWAQKPAIPPAGETIEVSIVNVDVFVTDKTGHRVRGLKRDDFEIFENGARQPITNFAEYQAQDNSAAPERTEGGRPNEAATPQARTVIVFVERIYLPRFRIDPLFAGFRKLLHDTIRPGDRAAIVTWNRGVLLTMQEFTDSLPRLDHTLDRLASLMSHPMLDPTAETRWSIADIEAFDAQAASLAGGGTSGGDSLADLELQATAEREIVDLKRKIRSINALIRSIAAAEGKKVLLLATHRLSLEAGAEHYYAAGRTTIGAEKRQALDMRALIRSIEETANANGVTIYPMFPEGLQTSMGDSASGSSAADYLVLNNETPALREIADATGGATAWGSTDVERLFPHVREDLDTYYSLAYRLRNSGQDRARKIVVKTRDPSLVVRSRREFMEKSDVTRMEDRVIAALFRNPPSPGFPVRVEIGARRARGKQFILPVTVHIPIAALTPLPAGRRYGGAFSVYLAWGGKLGGISDTTHETKNYSIPAEEIDKARTGELTYDFEIQADPRTERVALGIQDEVSKEYSLRLIQLKK